MPLYRKALLPPRSFCPLPLSLPPRLGPILAQVDLSGGSVKIKPTLAGAPEATVTIPNIQACKALVHVVDQVGRAGGGTGVDAAVRCMGMAARVWAWAAL